MRSGLVVYPGADASASIYEDDGRTLGYQRDGWMRIAMRWRQADRAFTISLAPGSRMLPPARRTFEITLAGAAGSRSIAFDGRTVTVRL